MNEFIEFFSDLFTTKYWPPRWKCGYWSDFHGYLYIASELMVWLAYFLIPLIIMNYFARKKSIIRFQKVYLLFASFILLCGSTHFLDALMFWVPMYRFNAVVRLLTGIVSLVTVYHLFKILPQAFKQKTSTELENEIRQRESAELKLAIANAELREANKGLEAFAYVASHDLQEPLRKIRTFTDMAERHGSFEEQGRMYMDRIRAASTRMSGLIEDVLSLSRITGNVERKIIDPNRAVERAMSDLELKIAERKAVINVAPMPKIRGDEGYLTQLFYNLINNAIKFSEAPPVINIDNRMDGDIVEIRVSDNGIGIDKEYVNQIFEPFQRLHARHEYEGSGIGLAISKKIVDVHGGQLTVESEKGKGSTFIIRLPWAFSGK